MANLLCFGGRAGRHKDPRNFLQSFSHMSSLVWTGQGVPQEGAISIWQLYGLAPWRRKAEDGRPRPGDVLLRQYHTPGGRRTCRKWVITTNHAPTGGERLPRSTGDDRSSQVEVFPLRCAEVLGSIQELAQKTAEWHALEGYFLGDFGCGFTGDECMFVFVVGGRRF